jgi:Beta protein
MFAGYYYYPDLKISPSEITAIHNLPGPDKDNFLPIIRLRRWVGSAKLENSLQQIDKALGNDRPCILDIEPPKNVNSDAERDLNILLNPHNGYEHWVNFIRDHERFIPVLQSVGGNVADVINEANALARLGRGLVIRLSRVKNWNLDLLSWVDQVAFEGLQVLIILDYGQIERNADVNAIAATLTGLAIQCSQVFNGANLFITITASSFPSNFAEINRKTARLDILERQLFRSVASAVNGQAVVRYGDYGSVFAGERGIARGGAPRIDPPKPARWIYHRNESGGYQEVASAIIADSDWDQELVIWGTERIREAAEGTLGNMTHQRAWTAVRIHLHLHQQIHFGGSPNELYDTDEEWKD